MYLQNKILVTMSKKSASQSGELNITFLFLQIVIIIVIVALGDDMLVLFAPCFLYIYD